MIISHRHKYIFLKTRKTASTSLEIALSQSCGPDDIITPITPSDEIIRKELGYRGPQNYKIPIYKVPHYIKLYKATKGKRFRFYNHIQADLAKSLIGERIWNEYFKFTVERNPYDRAISRFYWSKRNKDDLPDINETILSWNSSKLSNWEIYTINNKIITDFIIKYESLEQDLNKVQQILGLLPLNLPRAKGGHRKDKRHYSLVLSVECQKYIEKTCKNEIEQLGYFFETCDL